MLHYRFVLLLLKGGKTVLVIIFAVASVANLSSRGHKPCVSTSFKLFINFINSLKLFMGSFTSQGVMGKSLLDTNGVPHKIPKSIYSSHMLRNYPLLSSFWERDLTLVIFKSIKLSLSASGLSSFFVT